MLREPVAHAGGTYSLTGPASITMAEAASEMSRVLGRPYRFEDETPAEAYASRASYGAPPWQLDAWVSLDQVLAR